MLETYERTKRRAVRLVRWLFGLSSPAPRPADLPAVGPARKMRSRPPACTMCGGATRVVPLAVFGTCSHAEMPVFCIACARQGTCPMCGGAGAIPAKLAAIGDPYDRAKVLMDFGRAAGRN